METSGVGFPILLRAFGNLGSVRYHTERKYEISHPVTFVRELYLQNTEQHQTPICSFRLIASRNGNVAKIILYFSEAIWEMDGMFVRVCL